MNRSIDDSLGGKKISSVMTQEEYDAIIEKDPNTIYLVDDDNAIKGVPDFSEIDANKVLMVNADGTSMGWMSLNLSNENTGPTGETGATGATGENAPIPNFSIGSVVTLPVGSNATVTLTGTYPNLVLNFGIPLGAINEIVEHDAVTKDDSKLVSKNGDILIFKSTQL